jgi:predicted house-cleaning noncanonical NTP pyrophosphatase (MazG superfamily)
VTGPKLIRDLIPKLAADRGDTMTVRVADPAEMPGLLRRKLVEEVTEYLDSGDPEELADVLEVLHELAALHGWTPAALDGHRRAKARERGYFARRLVWAGESGG